MAGDWIKIRKDLLTDPAVMHLGSVLGLDVFQTVGRLAAVWCWADTHADGHGRVTLPSRSSNAPVTQDRYASVDTVAQCAGFGDALCAVGWLTCAEDGSEITFPRFEKHMGVGAKARCQSAKRQESQRIRMTGQYGKSSRSGNAPVTQDRDTSVTREEKRREEEKTEEPTPETVVAHPPKTPTALVGPAPIPAALDTPAFAWAWSDWLRLKSGAKLKPDGQRRQLDKLADIGPVAAVSCIEHSLSNQYAGLFPEKFDPRTRRGSPGAGLFPDAAGKTESRIAAQIAEALRAP